MHLSMHCHFGRDFEQKVCPNSLSACRLNCIPATLHGNYPIVVPQFDFSNIKFPLSLTPRMEVGDNIDRCISARHNLIYTQILEGTSMVYIMLTKVQYYWDLWNSWMHTTYASISTKLGEIQLSGSAELSSLHPRLMYNWHLRIFKSN